MMTFANSLGPDQALHIGPNLQFDTPIVFLKEFFEKVHFEKKSTYSKHVKSKI